MAPKIFLSDYVEGNYMNIGRMLCNPVNIALFNANTLGEMFTIADHVAPEHFVALMCYYSRSEHIDHGL
jgi:hypothetical protein